MTGRFQSWPMTKQSQSKALNQMADSRRRRRRQRRRQRLQRSKTQQSSKSRCNGWDQKNCPHFESNFVSRRQNYWALCFLFLSLAGLFFQSLLFFLTANLDTTENTFWMFGAFHPKKGTSFFFFFFIVAKKRLRRSVRSVAGLSSERATDARKGVSKNLGGGKLVEEGEYRTGFCRDEPKNKIKPMNKKIEPGPGEGWIFHFWDFANVVWRDSYR